MSSPQAVILVESLKADSAFQAQLSAYSSGPSASTDPQLAIDIKWLIDQLPSLLPLVLTLVTGGGFSPALIPVIINIIAQLFGVSETEAIQLVTA